MCIFCFCLCYVGEIGTEKKEKKKMEKAKNPIKLVFFKVVMQKCEKSKKCFFCLQKLSDTICVRKGEKPHFRAHSLFWPKNVFGPKQCKPGKTMKIVVSAEIAQNQK